MDNDCTRFKEFDRENATRYSGEDSVYQIPSIIKRNLE